MSGTMSTPPLDAPPLEGNRSADSRTVELALRQGVRALLAHSGSPQLDAEVLLSAVLGVGRSTLIARGADPLPEDALRTYRDLLEQRRSGMPVAYLTGRREFWSLPLKITPAVLVPRHETEILVEVALTHLPVSAECAVLDLGTGSGAVALAIASERPLARVVGVDVSPGALGVARENARALALRNATFRLGSWFDAVPAERFDVVVANPPYIAVGDPALDALAAEPALALVAGPEGLDALAAIIAQAPSHLTRGGWLLLEHGSSQQLEVARLLERRGFTAVDGHSDYSGLPRVTRGTLPSPPKERTHDPLRDDPR
jgi:release factor glutamine methyltransferase